MELITGKSLNIAPTGYGKAFNSLGEKNIELENSRLFLKMGLEASIHQGKPIILIHPKNAEVIPCTFGKKSVRCIVRK